MVNETIGGAMEVSLKDCQSMYLATDVDDAVEINTQTELLTDQQELLVYLDAVNQKLKSDTLQNITEDTHKAADNKMRNETDIDKGYAWVVLLGCFVMFTLSCGSIKAYGVLYTEMVEYYSAGYGNTAWIGGIAALLLDCLGPIANLLCRRFSFRLVTFVGGIFLGLGYSMSAFVTKMEFMYITFLFSGIGHGLTFSPCSTIVSFYFDKRRALANGITVSGSGIGALALPLLYKFLIDTYGLSGTLWITGAVLCNTCVAACLFRQPKIIVEENQQTQGSLHIDTQHRERLEVKKKRCQKGCRMNLKFSLFKNPLFTIYVISFVLCEFSCFGSYTLIPSYVKALGYNETYVALSVTIIGGVEIFARIFIGWFADLKIVKPKYIFVTCMFIGAIFSFIVPLFDSFTFIAIYSAAIAMFPSSFLGLISVMVIDVLGLELLPAAFGLVSLCLGVGSGLSQPSIGWIKDYFGSWHPAFMLNGGVFLVAGIIVLTEPVIIRFRSNGNKRKTAETRL